MHALVISDLHYVHAADHVCTIPERQTALALELCQRAFECLCSQGIALDLAIVLGDVVDDGTADGAEDDLAAIAETMRSWQVPVLAVPGNHDGDGDRFAEIFGCPLGLCTVGDTDLLLFEDRVGEGHVTTRPEPALCMPVRTDGKRLVALQHNPLYPPIESDYPFLLSNANAVLDAYREAGVILSLSGHYHPGQAVNGDAGVICYTAPALCEAPFRFAHLEIDGQSVTIREFALENEGACQR